MQKGKMLWLLMFCGYWLNAQMTIEQFDYGIRLNYVTKTTGFTGKNVVVGIEDGVRVDIDKVAMRNRVNFKSNKTAPPDHMHATHVVMKSMDSGNSKPCNQRSAHETTILSPFHVDSMQVWFMQDSLRLVNRSLGYNNPVGSYNSKAVKRDQQIRSAKKFMYFFSSGNNRKKGVIGDYGWYGTGGTYPLSGSDTTFASLTGADKHAKNVFTVNSYGLNDIPTSSGSSGPAYDGRIKPEVTATGLATSFSSPQVAAMYAVLMEAYKAQHQGVEPYSDYMKALILNSADDMGRPGPDYRTGFGKVNARRAYEAMQDDWTTSLQVAQDDTLAVDFDEDGSKKLIIPAYPAGVSDWAELKIMVYWHDVASDTYNPQNSNAYKALVNDINMQALHQTVNGTDIYDPLILEHLGDLDAPAEQGVDSLNNMEQIVISNPQPGDIVKVYLHGFDILTDSQRCVVVYDLVPKELVLTHPVANLGGEKFRQNDTEFIRWDANGFASGDEFVLDYKIEGTGSWIGVDTVTNVDYRPNRPRDYSHEKDRHKKWTIPSSIPNLSRIKIRIRAISNGSLVASSVSGWVNVSKTVSNLEVDWISGTAANRSAGFSWSPVDNATAYRVYRLFIDEKFMQLDTVVTGTTVQLDNIVVGDNQQQFGTGNWNEWVSVAPVFQGVEGRACKALEIPRGELNIDFVSAMGATHVNTHSANLHAKVLPRQNVKVAKVQFQYAVADGTLNFINDGNYFDNNGQGFTETTKLSYDLNGLWNPQLNTDQDYVYRLKMELDFNADGTIDAIDFSNVAPIQVPSGSAAILNVGKYYTVKAIPEYTANQSRTIEFWAKANEFNFGNLITQGANNNDGNGLDALIFGTSNQTDKWQFVVNDGEQHVFEIPQSHNSWHHYAIVYDGPKEELYVVVDGEKIEDSVISELILNTEFDDLQIGGRFVGLFDELRCWKTVRSIDEIRERIHYSIREVFDAGNVSGYSQDLMRYVQFDDESEWPLEAVRLTRLASQNDLGFIVSQIPVGDPEKGNNKFLNQGWNFFEGESTWIITQNGWLPDGDVAVSRIHTKPHNEPRLAPIANINNLPVDPSSIIIDTVFNRDYRAIHNHCPASPQTNYRFKILLPLEQSDITQPENIYLLGRAPNGAGNWNFINVADEIIYNPDSNTYFVFFNDLTTFGQFVAVRVASAPTGTEKLSPTLLSAANFETKIFPNPLLKTDVLNIETFDSPDPLQFYLYDQFGRLLKSMVLETTKTELNIADLVAGIYICEIVGKKNKRARHKLLVLE